MDNYLTEKEFWEKRAQQYDQLQWVKRQDYIDAIIDMCRLTPDDDVLCMGTGTGVPALYLCHAVRSVIGVDFSDSMLEIARKNNRCDNATFVKADIRRLPFPDGTFSRMVARMVFHHLVWGLNRAMSEVYRLLTPGGLFCVSEGVPPDRCVEDFYKEIFALKEKRRTFFPEDLRNILHTSGLDDLEERTYVMKHCSIRNWLNNAGNLTTATKEKIYQMHLNLHERGKQAYHMEITDTDCYIDMKFVIITGRKYHV